MKPASK